MATGLAAAMNYVLGFIATKTYYNLEIWLSIPGTTLFYSIINIVGLVTKYIGRPLAGKTFHTTCRKIVIFEKINKKNAMLCAFSVGL